MTFTEPQRSAIRAALDRDNLPPGTSYAEELMKLSRKYSMPPHEIEDEVLGTRHGSRLSFEPSGNPLMPWIPILREGTTQQTGDDKDQKT